MVNAANLDQVAEAGLTQVWLAFLFVCFTACLFVLCASHVSRVYRFIRPSFSVRLRRPKSEPGLSFLETLLGDMTYL